MPGCLAHILAAVGLVVGSLAADGPAGNGQHWHRPSKGGFLTLTPTTTKTLASKAGFLNLFPTQDEATPKYGGFLNLKTAQEETTKETKGVLDLLPTRKETAQKGPTQKKSPAPQPTRQTKPQAEKPPQKGSSNAQPDGQPRSNDQGVQSLSVRIALTQQNIEYGYELIANLSDPMHPQYAQYLTQEEVNKQFAPEKSVLESILDWLSNAGITASTSANGGFVAFDAPPDSLVSLLGADLDALKGAAGPFLGSALDKLKLPDHIASHVDFFMVGPSRPKKVLQARSQMQTVAPKMTAMTDAPAVTISLLPVPTDTSSEPVTGLSCAEHMSPSCFRELYGLPEPSGSLPEGAIGVFSPNNLLGFQSDLDSFFAKEAPYVPSDTHPHPVMPAGESEAYVTIPMPELTLDLEVVYGLLGPVNVTVWQTDEFMSQFSEDSDSVWQSIYEHGVGYLFDIMGGSYCTEQEREERHDCGSQGLPQVLSISYAVPELMGYAQQQHRLCDEIMKLGLQGKTVVSGSGDDGVASNSEFSKLGWVSDEGCFPDQNESGREVFMPGFPATCPYVLAVGATMLDSSSDDPTSEMAMSVTQFDEVLNTQRHLMSGGGYSNFFHRSAFQDSAQIDYLTNHAPDFDYYHAQQFNADDFNTTGLRDGVYNVGGRAFPDVSANGAYFPMEWLGSSFKASGTSISAPVWASIIALLNRDRAAVGKAPVGYVNRVLYEHPEVFHDITSGSNPGCGTEGFSAVEGWDPVTGLGTPKYPALHELFVETLP